MGVQGGCRSRSGSRRVEVDEGWLGTTATGAETSLVGSLPFIRLDRVEGEIDTTRGCHSFLFMQLDWY
jgi:hypothetical protein